MLCFLDTTSAAFQVAGTAFNSSTFQPSGNVKRNGGSMLAYCFAEKQGYSKFGSYVGNGNGEDGPFVYTGFKPAFVMIKRTDSAGGWTIYDHKRGHNGNNYELLSKFIRSRIHRNFYYEADLLSNGFQVKTMCDKSIRCIIHLHGICRKSIRNINRNPNNSEVNYVGISRKQFSNTGLYKTQRFNNR